MSSRSTGCNVYGVGATKASRLRTDVTKVPVNLIRVPLSAAWSKDRTPLEPLHAFDGRPGIP